MVGRYSRSLRGRVGLWDFEFGPKIDWMGESM